MLKSIIAIITASTLIYSTIKIEDTKKRTTVNDILVWVLSIILLCVMVKSNIVFKSDIKSAYNNGFNTAIQAAELVEVNEDCYHIAFGDEVHCYER